jgi:hypothetical protein
MAVTKILVGIDGTGPFFDSQYEKDFASSFVTRLAYKGNDNYKYFRGPIVPGGGLSEAIDGAFQFIKEKATSTRGMTNVLLTGYSRGATGIVCVAKKLQDAKIDVHAMLLFDCVDMHLFFDAETIPQNVRNVWHLTRHPDSGSRTSWGNDALYYYPSSTNMELKRFMCTHGALGGVPSAPGDGQSRNDFIEESGGGTTNITYSEDARMSGVI